MAVSTPVLATPVVGATATSTVTASFTPTADAILIAFAVFRGSGGAIPTISDSLGGTWTPIAAGQDAGLVGGRLWYQEVGSSPAARTVTAQSAGATQTGLLIVEVTGASTDFSNYGFDITTGFNQSVTLSAYQTGSQVLAGRVDNAGGTQNYPSVFVELYDSNAATNLRVSAAYAPEASAPPTTINTDGSSSDTYAWGLEVKEASGTPAQTINGSLFTDPDTFFGATVSPGPVTIAGSLFANSNAFYTAVVSQAGAPQQIDGGLFTNTPQFFSATLTSVVRINAQLYNDPDQFFAATITVAGGGGGDSGAEYIILRRRRR